MESELDKKINRIESYFARCSFPKTPHKLNNAETVNDFKATINANLDTLKAAKSLEGYAAETAIYRLNLIKNVSSLLS